MFPFWLILGIVTVFAGIFNRQILERLGSKPNSEVFTIPHRKQSARIVEQMGKWLVITLGVSFLVLGLGAALPVNVSSNILIVLLVLSGSDALNDDRYHGRKLEN